MFHVSLPPSSSGENAANPASPPLRFLRSSMRLSGNTHVRSAHVYSAQTRFTAPRFATPLGLVYDAVYPACSIAATSIAAERISLTRIHVNVSCQRLAASMNVRLARQRA